MDRSIFISFFLLLLVAALVTVLKSRRQTNRTSVGYFLGSRSFNFWMIGCSIFLTNMSANQFIGENEFVYTTNVSVIAWGMSSILAIIIVAECLMPVYLRIGAVTTPDFLGLRFDKQTQQMVSVIFLLSYIVNLIPTVLYGCAVAMNGLFHIDERMGISYFAAIRILVVFIGIIGCLYTVLGGLRAITITDMVQGAGMVIGGVCITWLGLRYLGNGHLLAGLEELVSNNREHLNAIGGPHDAIPFGTVFTGMLLINIYYWGMEQYIIQEAFASKSLAESQKGLSLAAVGKLLAPLLLNVPGLIALQLYPHLDNTAAVFPKMVGDVLPPLMAGFIAAVVFGGALSTFNAGLNSIGTLFIMNIYKPWLVKKNSDAGEAKLLRHAKLLQVAVTVGAVVFAPYIMLFSGGFYNYLQKAASFFSVPVFTIMLVGLITKRVPAIAAKIGLVFFVIAYAGTQFFIDTRLHYLHVLAILFLLTGGLMLLIGRFRPMEQRFQLPALSGAPLQPWRSRYFYYALLLVLMISVFLVFSPVGLAR